MRCLRTRLSWDLILIPFISACLMAGCQRPGSLAENGEKRDEAEFDQVRFDPPQLVLGEWMVGTSKAFFARLINNGSSAIRVSAIQPSCGCTEVSLTKKTLLPRETADLSGVFDPRTMPGHLRKSITLKLKGRSEGSVRLELVGTVCRKIQLSSARFILTPDFLRTIEGYDKLIVHNALGKTVSLRMGELPRAISSKIAKPILAPGEQTVIAFSAASTLLNEIQGGADLYTTDPYESIIPLKYSVCPKNAIRSEPKAIRFGVVSKKDLASQKEFTIVLQGPALAKATVDKIITPAHLRLVEKALSGRNSMLIRFGLTISPALSLLDGEIEVQLSWKSPKTSGILRIPVSGILLDAH